MPDFTKLQNKAKLVFTLRSIKGHLLQVSPLFIFIFLSVFALRDVLKQQGIVGFGWDWGNPAFSYQYVTQLSSRFHAWYRQVGLGRPTIFPIGTYYYLILTTLSLAGGEFGSKSALVFLMSLSGLSMFYLCRKLKLNLPVSLVSAIFYMYSPVAYSRLIAGHQQFLFGYALMPLFVASIFSFFNSEEFSLYRAIIIGTLFTLTSDSHVYIVLSLIVFTTFSIIECIMNRKRLSRLPLACVSIATLFILLNMYHLFSFFANLSPTVTWYTERTASSQQLLYLYGTSTNVLDSLRLLAVNGMHTEFIFPVEDAPQILWQATSFIIPFLAFSVLIARPQNKRFITFTILAVLGISLISITKTAIGRDILLPVLSNVGVILALFQNVNRFNPLIALSYAVLLGFTLNKIYSYVSHPLQRLVNRPMRRWLEKAPGVITISIFLLLILVYSWPFVAGDLAHRPTFALLDQPYQILVTPIDPEYERVHNFIYQEPGDFRIAYLPSPFTGYPIKYWEGNRTLFHSTEAFWPKPEFTWLGDSLPQFIVTTLHQKVSRSNYLSTIYGLANVKYIVFTYNLNFANYAPTLYYPDLVRNMLLQENLVELKDVSYGDTKVYENLDYIPHIYPTQSATLISGDLSSLISLIYTPGFAFDGTAMFLPQQLQDDQLRSLLDLNSTVVVLHDNDLIDLITPLLPADAKIYPGLHVISPSAAYGTDPYKGWVNLEPFWWYNWYFSSRQDRKYGCFTLTNSSVEIPYVVETEGPRDFYLLLYTGPRGSTISLSVDQNVIGRVVTENPIDREFKWTYFGDYSLSRGNHTIVLQSEEKHLIAAVVAIAAIPKGFVEQTFKGLPTQNYILLNEAEEFGYPQLIDNSSQGYAAKLGYGGWRDDFEYWENATVPLNWYEGEHISTGKIIREDLNVANGTYSMKIMEGGCVIRLVDPVLSTSDLSLAFSFCVPEFTDPGSPDQHAIIWLRFTDETTLSYVIGYDTLLTRESETDKIVILSQGPNDYWKRAIANIASDMNEKFGCQKNIKEIRIGTSNAIAYFDDFEFFTEKNQGVNGKLYIPRDGRYELFARIRVAETTTLTLEFGGNEKTILLPSSEDQFKWYNLGQFSLKSGFTDFAFYANVFSASMDLFSLRSYDEEGRGKPQPTENAFHFSMVNPSKYQVRFNTSSPFFLVFSEHYHPKWLAHIGSEVIHSIPSIGSLNVFYIDRTGDLKITIEYKDQSLTELGYYITLLSWIGLIAISFFDWKKKLTIRRFRELVRLSANLSFEM